MSSADRPVVEWRSWMEDLDHIRRPPPVYARPAGLGSLGEGSYFIEPYTVRSPDRVHVGDAVGIGERCFLSVGDEDGRGEGDSVLRIEDNTLISTDLRIQCPGGVEIGTGTGISARVFIGASRGWADPSEPAPVRVGAGSLIGIGAVLMAGVTVGERAVVAAAAVVTRDVPPHSVVFGNPARVIRSWDATTGTWRLGAGR